MSAGQWTSEGVVLTLFGFIENITLPEQSGHCVKHGAREAILKS